MAKNRDLDHLSQHIPNKLHMFSSISGTLELKASYCRIGHCAAVASVPTAAKISKLRRR